MSPSSENALDASLLDSPLLFGRDRDASVRLVALAVVSFPLALVAFSPAGTFGVEFSLSQNLGTVSLILVLAVVPALAAFYNDGLLVCVLLTFGPALAHQLSWALYELDDQRATLGSVVWLSVFVAVLAGLFGFACGYFARRFFES
ncbi:hypothetical protein [Halorussus halophilus]|uniref:hypothetical protein n=1 Tax=Halorussus halophilus TaxID=2650975 RepID=UPI0013017185|nr:hypothetical protein [Halorussus halophilus]